MLGRALSIYTMNIIFRVSKALLIIVYSQRNYTKGQPIKDTKITVEQRGIRTYYFLDQRQTYFQFLMMVMKLGYWKRSCYF